MKLYAVPVIVPGWPAPRWAIVDDTGHIYLTCRDRETAEWLISEEQDYDSPDCKYSS